jgi:hypothetical protein
MIRMKFTSSTGEDVTVYLDNGVLGGLNGISWQEDVDAKTTWTEEAY